MPYWPPCCRLATPDQLAQKTPLEALFTVTVVTSALFA